MVHFLRTKDNNTIFEIEIREYENGILDLYPSIDIYEYSKRLLKYEKEENQIMVDMWVSTFVILNDLRGWLHETYSPFHENITKEHLIKILRKQLIKFSKQLDLGYTED